MSDFWLTEIKNARILSSTLRMSSGMVLKHKNYCNFFFTLYVTGWATEDLPLAVSSRSSGQEISCFFMESESLSPLCYLIFSQLNPIYKLEWLAEWHGVFN